MESHNFWLSASDIINEAMRIWLFSNRKGENKKFQDKGGEYSLYSNKRCHVEYPNGSSVDISTHPTYTIARYQSPDDGGYEVCTVWCSLGHLILNVESHRNRYVYKEEECATCNGKIDYSGPIFRECRNSIRHI